MAERREQVRCIAIVAATLSAVVFLCVATTFLGRSAARRFAVRQAHEPAPKGMVYIPAGRFTMGSDEVDAEPGERPARSIFVAAFYIDRYEVTNSDFRDVFSEHEFPDGEELHPVTNVTKKKAQEYCRAVGKRLPTSAEWEKAARGTDARAYPWGDLYDPSLANVGGRHGGVLPVGSFPEGVSPYGVHDMAGNAWEWVSDVYIDRVPFGEAGLARGILRGGAHGYGKLQAKTSYVGFEGLENTCNDTGFRCAMDAVRLRKK